MPESGRMFQPSCSWRNSISRLASGVPFFDLQAGVDVLGVLPENDHIDQVGALDRGGHALEPPDRSQADVQVQDLAQGDVQRAKAAAHGCSQRALDTDQVLTESVQCLRRQPVAGLPERLLPGQHLGPGDAVPLLGDGSVYDPSGRGPYVHARPVAFDEGDYGLSRDLKVPVEPHRDLVCHG